MRVNWIKVEMTIAQLFSGWTYFHEAMTKEFLFNCRIGRKKRDRGLISVDHCPLFTQPNSAIDFMKDSLCCWYRFVTVNFTSVNWIFLVHFNERRMEYPMRCRNYELFDIGNEIKLKHKLLFYGHWKHKLYKFLEKLLNSENWMKMLSFLLTIRKLTKFPWRWYQFNYQILMNKLKNCQMN